jgi:hypothetical protein
MRKQGSVEPQCECFSPLLDCDSLQAPGHKTYQGLLQSTFGTKNKRGSAKTCASEDMSAEMTF